MSRLGIVFLPFLLATAVMSAQAQTPIPTSGTMVIVPAFSEVRHPNDEAHITLMIEEQDKDKTAAASRVNKKMKQGGALVKQQDPQAILTTRGYYTYPVYPDEAERQTNKSRQPASWRVGQYLDVTTTNLATLPQTVAAAQQLLALSALNFGLTPATAKKLDDRRIATTYQNLTARIAAIAKAMGRNVNDSVLDTIDFEGSGAYAQQQEGPAPRAMMLSASAKNTAVEEPSFEPGETTLHMRVVAKVKFK